MIETCAAVLVTITAVAWGRTGGPVCAAWVRDVFREMDPGRPHAEVVPIVSLAEHRAV